MKKLFLFPLVFLLAACQAGTAGNIPPLSFRQHQPIYMKVSNIQVLEEYRSPGGPPNVEHLMPYTPADAMQLWVKQRLKASGGPHTMQVVIRDASVVEKQLPVEGGLTGMFKVQQDKEYHARLEVEFRIYGDASLSEANIKVVGERMLTLTEDVSPAQRQEQFALMIRDLMQVMNAELEKNIYQHLGAYVNFSMAP